MGRDCLAARVSPNIQISLEGTCVNIWGSAPLHSPSMLPARYAEKQPERVTWQLKDSVSSEEASILLN